MPNRRILLSAAAATLPLRNAAFADAPPPTYFVLFYHPGPKWIPGQDFGDQPGIMNHVNYLAGFFAKGELVTGGPFLDNTGGMAIFDTGTIAKARAIAASDPTVKAGLLTVTVKPWMPAFQRR